MKRGLLLLALLAGLAFADSCEAEVDDASVHLIIKEFITPSIYNEHIADIGLYDHAGVFSYTRIYFAGLDASEMCTAGCDEGDPSDYLANFVVVTESEGKYSQVAVFGLEDGKESPVIRSEGKDFSFIVSDFGSDFSCNEFKDEDFEYCDDGTRIRACSYTLPYRCIRDQDDHLNLTYQPFFCGKPDWLNYSEGCSEGTVFFCDTETNSVMRRICEDSKWVTVFMEDCDNKGTQCHFNVANASCSPIPSENTCPDGTEKGGCSLEKPWYCNDQKVLVKSPKVCGCPPNAIYEPTTLSCVYLYCKDGTPVGECSDNLPQYCTNDGDLVNMSSGCGCPQGYAVQGESCMKEVANETPAVNQTPPAPEPPAEPQPPIQNETPPLPKPPETPQAEPEIPNYLLLLMLGAAAVVAIVIAYFLFKK